MIKNDDWIRKQCMREHLPSADALPMIEPFEPEQVRGVRILPDGTYPVPGYRYPIISTKKVISYGTSSNGYDIRCAAQFKIFHNALNTLIDPKNFDPRCFLDYDATETGFCILPPNSFVLTKAVEYLRVPRNILVLCIGKSTYARTGLIVNVTPAEPEWEGNLTIEISNTTPLPAKVYANEGIAQLLFLESDAPCAVSYKDRAGKYNYDTEIHPPKL